MNACTAVAYFSFGNSSVNVNRMFALKYNNVIVCVCECASVPFELLVCTLIHPFVRHHIKWLCVVFEFFPPVFFALSLFVFLFLLLLLLLDGK